MRDTQLISSALSSLPRLYVELHLELPHRGRPTGEIVTMSREAPVPLNLGVDALMREMVNVVLTWEEICLEADRAGTLPGRALYGATQALRDNLGRLLELPATAQVRGQRIVELTGVDAGLDVLRLQQRAERLLHRATYLETRPAPCRACDQYTLVRETGTERTRCETCGWHCTEAGYLAWVTALTSG